MPYKTKAILILVSPNDIIPLDIVDLFEPLLFGVTTKDFDHLSEQFSRLAAKSDNFDFDSIEFVAYAYFDTDQALDSFAYEDAAFYQILGFYYDQFKDTLV